MNRMAAAVAGVLVAVAVSGAGTVNAESTGTTPESLVGASAMETTAVEPVRSRQATGTIISVDREAGIVTVKARSGETTFVLSPRVRVKVGNLKATLDDIAPGQRVFVRYRDLEAGPTATTIRVL